jgi:hypothetical protein
LELAAFIILHDNDGYNGVGFSRTDGPQAFELVRRNAAIEFEIKYVDVVAKHEHKTKAILDSTLPPPPACKCSDATETTAIVTIEVTCRPTYMYGGLTSSKMLKCFLLQACQF